MKLYKVEVYTILVVACSDDDDPHVVALEHASQAIRDSEPEATVIAELRSAKDLDGSDWDDECLPYGGDGEKRIKDYL